jgi:hypothetical protein
MEWDEVLYARSLRHYDVATHSPHPPGYPVYVAAAKIFAMAGIDPIHATQLVSVMAALLALVNLSRLLAGWGLRKEGWYVALTLALLPVFIFAANLGLTEMLACALSLWGLRRLWVLHERGDSLAAVLFGAAAALSLGARPQMLLLFLLPTCGVLWELSRKGNFRWLWGVLTGGVVSLAVWLPPIFLTGWQRYISSVKDHIYWMAVYEARARFPLISLSEFVDNWLLRPLGPKAIALSFWVLVGWGSISLWRRGHRQGVAFLWTAGGFYLLAAPWFMPVGSCVRYSLPGFIVLAGLLAGFLAAGKKSWPWQVLPVVALGLERFFLALPALTLRAAEPNPVWAVLTWVREELPLESVTCANVMRPHAEYVLQEAGWPVAFADEPEKGEDRPFFVGEGPVPPGFRVLYYQEWPPEPMASLTLGRYLKAWVIRR